MPKKISILHPMPMERTVRRALLPFGLFLNRDLQTAKPGARVVFCDGVYQFPAELVSVRKVDLYSPDFRDWLKIIYGGSVSASGLLKRFEQTSVADGCGVEGYDKSKCLLVEVKPLQRPIADLHRP